jgi:hypothetical protein
VKGGYVVLRRRRWLPSRLAGARVIVVVALRGLVPRRAPIGRQRWPGVLARPCRILSGRQAGPDLRVCAACSSRGLRQGRFVSFVSGGLVAWVGFRRKLKSGLRKITWAWNESPNPTESASISSASTQNVNIDDYKRLEDWLVHLCWLLWALPCYLPPCIVFRK